MLGRPSKLGEQLMFLAVPSDRSERLDAQRLQRQVASVDFRVQRISFTRGTPDPSQYRDAANTSSRRGASPSAILASKRSPELRRRLHDRPPLPRRASGSPGVCGRPDATGSLPIVIWIPSFIIAKGYAPICLGLEDFYVRRLYLRIQGSGCGQTFGKAGSLPRSRNF